MLGYRKRLTVSIMSVRVDEEAGEGTVFVGVPAVNLAPVQLHTHLVPYIQVEDDAVGGVVVILVGVLSDRAGSYLRQRKGNKDGSKPERLHSEMKIYLEHLFTKLIQTLPKTC